METKKWLKSGAKLLLTAAVTTLLLMLLNIGMDGMYLLGIPEIRQVEKVLISDSRYPGQTKEVSDEESIELAVKLSGFLRYRPFAPAEEPKEPRIAITYITKDGGSVSLSADSTSVLWQGNVHALKEEGIFQTLCEGIFFFPEGAQTAS